MLRARRLTLFPPSLPYRSAGHLGSSNSSSMPNLVAKNGRGGAGGGGSGGGTAGGQHGVYMHSQSQPSSQYRIKEYPLYVEGSPNPVVVRNLESDQEGHYSVKAQFKPWGVGDDGAEGSGRLTPSRSQIVRTPSLGRDGTRRQGGWRRSEGPGGCVRRAALLVPEVVGKPEGEGPLALAVKCVRDGLAARHPGTRSREPGGDAVQVLAG